MCLGPTKYKYLHVDHSIVCVFPIIVFIFMLHVSCIESNDEIKNNSNEPKVYRLHVQDSFLYSK